MITTLCALCFIVTLCYYIQRFHGSINTLVSHYTTKKQLEQKSETVRLLGCENARMHTQIRNLEKELYDNKSKLELSQQLQKMSQKELAEYKIRYEINLKELQGAKCEIIRLQQTVANHDNFWTKMQENQICFVNQILNAQTTNLVGNIVEPIKQYMEKGADKISELTYTVHITEGMQSQLGQQVNMLTEKLYDCFGNYSVSDLLRSYGMQPNIDYFVYDDYCMLQLTPISQIMIETVAISLDAGTYSASIKSDILANINSKIRTINKKRDNIAILYVPMNNILNAVLEQDHGLFNYCASKGNILASPGTIMILTHVLKYYKQQEQSMVQATSLTLEVDELFTGFQQLVEHLANASKGISDARTHCQNAIRAVMFGQNGLISKLDAIRHGRSKISVPEGILAAEVE